MCDCLPSNQRANTVPSSWINQSGRVAHPDAPAGGGGGGSFRSTSTLGITQDGEMLPDPQSPSARQVDQGLVQLAGETEAAKAKRQAAPTIASDAADEVVNGIMTLKLKADDSGVSGIVGALTSFNNNSTGQVNIHSNDQGFVDSVTNTLSWTIEIFTQYGSGEPEADAAYGRGTTQPDKDAGNVTLGFHESCHRADLLNYFRTEPIPVLLIDASGKTPTATANTARATYINAWTAYFDKIRKFSVANTDEAIGSDPPLSKYKATP
ncbi:MAG: hypothetical protein ABI564_16800 [Ideonella sp.]